MKVSLGNDLVLSVPRLQTTHSKKRRYYFVIIEYTGSATFFSLKASMAFLTALGHEYFSKVIK